MKTSATDGHSGTPSTSSRKATLGAQVGLFIDMFDVYLPIIALAPAAMYFQPEGLSEGQGRLLTSAIFASTLLGRPLGALIFGHISDRSGRRRTTIFSLVGFGLCTLMIGFLPGHQAVGMFGIAALIALRFLDGVFLGGQYTAATPLALEQSPKSRRGFNGALIMTGFPLAYCAIALLTFSLLLVIPSGSLDSAYTQWGWRIPFVIGGVMALAWAFWYSRHVDESDAWIANKPKEGSASPVAELFRGDNLRGFIQVFVLMSGIWMSFNMIGAVLPATLRLQGGLSDTRATMVLVVAYATLVPAYLIAGTLGQRFGRRRFFLVQGPLTTVLAPVLFWLIASERVVSVGAIALTTIALVVTVVSVYCVASTYIIERFHVGVRSSGYGLGYTTAVILPAFYATYQAGLENFMPYQYTPLVLISLGGLLISIGAAIGPETKDVDLGPPQVESSEDSKYLAGSMVGLPYSDHAHRRSPHSVTAVPRHGDETD
ncbi:MFS transporter [Alloalcanivorax gelatiniphagus]